MLNRCAKLRGLFTGASILTMTLFGVFVNPNVASAQNAVYIAQTASGSANGSSCANAYAVGYFNSAANWTSGTPSGTQIGPGSTVYLCGTFTAASGATSYLTFQGGGSNGSPITLYFESGASIQSPGWNGPAINTGAYGYITINGGANGSIYSTLNGTSGATCPGGACAYQYSNGGAVGNGCCASAGSITVENLTVGPIYNRYCPSGQEANCPDENGGSTSGIYFNGGSNITIQNNTCHGAWACIGYGPGGSSSNITFSNNTVYQSNLGIQVSNGSAGAIISGIVVSGNNIYDGYNWSDTDNYNHHDGMHIFSVASGSQNNSIQVYDNFIHGNWGDGVNAWIFIECNSGGTCNSPEIFNNVLEDDTTVTHAGNGLLSIDGNSPVIVNNTMNGGAPGNSCILWTGTGATIENNVCENSYEALVYKASNYGTIDYNDYYNVGTGQWNQEGFSAWQTACSCDAHSITSNPNVPSATGIMANYLPPTGSPLIGTGTNLSSLGVTLIDSDVVGVSRSNSWGIGAYQSTTTASYAPPINIVSTVH